MTKFKVIAEYTFYAESQIEAAEMVETLPLEQPDPISTLEFPTVVSVQEM